MEHIGLPTPMAVDHDLWIKSFEALNPEALPAWPCPSCGETQLLLDKTSLTYKKNAEQYSRDVFKSEDFSEKTLLSVLVVAFTAMEKLQYIQHKFAGFMICQKCGESVVFSGKAELPRDKSGPAGYLNIKLYPEYFSPPLPFFKLHDCYPIDVRQHFIRAFGFSFGDAASAAIAVRQGVESLLDELGIARDVDGKKRLSLYERIKELGEKNSEHAELLEGIRFLGNEGGHRGKVKREDLIRAFDVIDHVLEDIYIRAAERKRVLKASKDLVKGYKKT